ncbi:spore germination protein [Gelria sp. Kuro-4]|uniref:spore germination protein n=1 Tax=Gelria sp. Kuro-4 TaxID=2796927 RepID=UPI001BEF362B|nr:spore germination protein [Gelria sp. Kuro-4]BCV25715.1 spore germination protein [Gelria sp. Kuro-4]
MLGFLRRLSKRQPERTLDLPEPEAVLGALAKVSVPPDLAAAVQLVKEALGNCPDVVSREVKLDGGTLVALYVDGLADKTEVEKILDSLLLKRPLAERAGLKLGTSLQRWQEAGLPVGEIHTAGTVGDVVTALLNGETCLLGEEWGQALLMDTKGWEKRQISEPDTEAVVRGPREGYVENLRTNTSLIRRRLRHPNLRIEHLVLGDLTNTQVVIIYIKGIANDKIVEEVRRRLKRIKIDGVLESGYLEELIEDAPFSPFPTVGHTERPDRSVAALLEGKVTILTDGTPFALSVPATINGFMQSPEDYYERWPVALGIRTFRYLGLFVSLLLPSLYVAITTFHQEMLPTALAVSLALQRERVPYPAVVEAFLMQITFELLVEAGVRLPRPLGQAIGIVGALVIGEAAVRAGLISAAMVIVISATAISSFTIPSFDLAIAVRMLRLPMILFGAVLGLFGIFTGLLLILIHLTTLRSFGVPYLAGIAPFIPRDQKDTVFRSPWWAMRTRPELVGFTDLKRQADDLKPHAPGDRRAIAEEAEAEAKGGTGTEQKAAAGRRDENEKVPGKAASPGQATRRRVRRVRRKRQ